MLNIKLICVAYKGDWPFLRKAAQTCEDMRAVSEAFNLATGFTSLRVCHLCSGEDP